MHCCSWPYYLQLAANQQIEFLVGATQFQVGLQRHRVVALHQGIQEFMHGDGHAALEALGEIVTLHHARHRVARGQLDDAARAQGIAPFGVVADFGTRRIQHQAGLGVVGLGVGLDLLARQRRAGIVAAAGVADHRREVADEKNDVVAQVLQLAHFVQHHGMPQVDVGRRGIQSQLDTQRHASGAAARQLAHELGLDQQFIAAALGDAQVGLDLGSNGGFRVGHSQGQPC